MENKNSILRAENGIKVFKKKASQNPSQSQPISRTPSSKKETN